MNEIGPAPGGLRQRNKTERRRRIVDAARALFAEKGYAASTTREIAERAGVGVGTLFAYAADKEALLALVVGDRLASLTGSAFAALPPDGPFLDQVAAVFRPRYAFWAADPGLSRHAVKATFAASYPEAPERGPGPVDDALRPRLRDLVVRAQRRGALGPAPPELVADVIVDVYLSETRDWVAAPAPDIEAGVGRLRKVLAFALGAVLPAQALGSEGERA